MNLGVSLDKNTAMQVETAPKYKSQFTEANDPTLTEIHAEDFTHIPRRGTAPECAIRTVTLPWGLSAEVEVHVHGLGDLWRAGSPCKLLGYIDKYASRVRGLVCGALCDVTISYRLYYNDNVAFLGGRITNPDAEDLLSRLDTEPVEYISLHRVYSDSLPSTLCDLAIWNVNVGSISSKIDQRRQKYCKFIHLRRSIKALTEFGTGCGVSRAVVGPIHNFPAELQLEIALRCDWQSLLMLTSTSTAMYALRNSYILRGVTQQRIYFREAMMELLAKTTPNLWAPLRCAWRARLWPENLEQYTPSVYKRTRWTVVYHYPILGAGGRIDTTTLLATRFPGWRGRVAHVEDDSALAEHGFLRVTLVDGGPTRTWAVCSTSICKEGQVTPVSAQGCSLRAYCRRTYLAGEQ